MDGAGDLRKMKIKNWWSAARNRERVVEEDSDGSRGPQWTVELMKIMTVSIAS
jgi:hypothetical protein